MSKHLRDEAIDQLFHGLVAFGRSSRGLAQSWSVSQPDLTRGDVVALGVVAECGACRPSALADHTGVGPSVVSRQLAHLQQLGLVERETDPEDGRAGLVSLTDAGRERLAAGKAAYLARLSERLEGWDHDQLRRAAELLDELAALLGNHKSSAKEQEPA